MAQRLKASSDASSKKDFAQRQMPAIPDDYIRWGSPARAASRGEHEHNAALPVGRRSRNCLERLSVLQFSKPASIVVTP